MGAIVSCLDGLVTCIEWVSGAVYGDPPGPIERAPESLMGKKANGYCIAPIQENLRFNVDRETANQIACHNRRFAEYANSFRKTTWLEDVKDEEVTTYYDVVTGKPLFRAPVGRTFQEFLRETAKHGWPSFRDEEVIAENLRLVGHREIVSVDGTHLGHNIPDGKGNRYCINLVSISGRPQDDR